jgi:hypothetical protein
MKQYVKAPVETLPANACKIETTLKCKQNMV